MDAFELLELIAVPIFVIDVGDDGALRYSGCNPHFCALTGRAASQIVGRTPAQVLGGDSGPRASLTMKAALASGEAKSCTLAFSAGECEMAATTLTPVAHADGPCTRLIGTVLPGRDANSRSGSPRDRDREQYLAMAAHDLRAPMRNVGILTTELRDGFRDLGDGKLQIIDMLEELGARASALVADVLAFTRANGADPGKLEEIDLATLTGTIFGVLDPASVHVMTAEPVTVFAEKVALQITLRNLADNALKHGDRAGLALSVSVEESGDDMIAFTVRDSGKGFGDPALAFLDSGKFRYDTGFGLLGLKRLISARGGTIAAIDTENGTGGKVRFTLPGRLIRPDGNYARPEAARRGATRRSLPQDAMS